MTEVASFVRAALAAAEERSGVGHRAVSANSDAALLDVNVLLALAWPTHAHHEAAHRWIGGCPKWATCPATQAAFVRLSMQPQVVSERVTISRALGLLQQIVSSPEHEFWPQTGALTSLLPELVRNCAGHKQVNDLVLLNLAIHRGGRLATFDERIGELLRGKLEWALHLEVIRVAD